MININDIVALGGVLVGVIGSILGITPYLNKKNVAVAPLIKVAEIIPTLKSTASLVDWIEKEAASGVKAAEQLYQSGSLQTNQEKFKAAQNTVYAALKEVDIEPTDNQKKLIDDFIQEAVNDLGHVSIRESEKQAQLQKMQMDLELVQTENTQLKQTISAMQSTVTEQK